MEDGSLLGESPARLLQSLELFIKLDIQPCITWQHLNSFQHLIRAIDLETKEAAGVNGKAMHSHRYDSCCWIHYNGVVVRTSAGMIARTLRRITKLLNIFHINGKTPNTAKGTPIYVICGIFSGLSFETERAFTAIYLRHQ